MDIKMKIKIPTIDDLKDADYDVKNDYLEKRHEWLKKVRKQDKKVVLREYYKVEGFLNRKKKREENPKYCKFCGKLIEKKAHKYCSKECLIVATRKKVLEYWHKPENKEKIKKNRREKYRKKHNVPKERWKV